MSYNDAELYNLMDMRNQKYQSAWSHLQARTGRK